MGRQEAATGLKMNDTKVQVAAPPESLFYAGKKNSFETFLTSLKLQSYFRVGTSLKFSGFGLYPVIVIELEL